MDPKHTYGLIKGLESNGSLSVPTPLEVVEIGSFDRSRPFRVDSSDS